MLNKYKAIVRKLMLKRLKSVFSLDFIHKPEEYAAQCEKLKLIRMKNIL